MAERTAVEVWSKILEALEDKLQYGLLEQAKAVTEVALEGDELILFVNTPEAHEFFSAHVNQQRLLLMSRPAFNVEKVSVRKAATE